MQKRIGDGTGSGANTVPEGQGDQYFENARPETPVAPYDSSRGGRGPEYPANSHRTTRINHRERT